MSTDVGLPDLEEIALAQLYCNATYRQELDSYNSSGQWCRVSWDGVSCWPVTLAGSTAYMSCFAELNGVQYDVHGNASRECMANAVWSKWSNYRACTPLIIPEDEYLQVLWDLREAVTVYYVGYGISLVALTVALWIFLRFKELRCLRNSIHVNLMLTYFLLDITWITTARLQSSHDQLASKMACFLTIALTYLMGTNFFWMFVEGLYLFILVVKTFSVDNVPIQFYALIGWLIPGLIAGAWAAMKSKYGSALEDALDPEGCPWQKRDCYDYIFILPVILILLVNIIFLTKIMWVLITKLRATNTVESEQYRKAAKALLVLIPLLGVTYILVIATPTHHTGEVIFTFIQAALLSIQGFIVAVLYCFLNGEVQNSVRHRLDRWRLRRAVQGRGHHVLDFRPSSPHGKFYRGRGVRDSCVSFATSTSFINLRSPSVPQQQAPPTTIALIKDDVL